MPRIAKPHYAMALVCYLAIPALMIVGVALSRLIDPEMARYSGDYTRNFRLLELRRNGRADGHHRPGTAPLARKLLSGAQVSASFGARGWHWLQPDRSGLCSSPCLWTARLRRIDLYQQFIGKLKLYWRIPLEIALFVSAWTLAYQCVALKRELLIRFESFSTGTPVETIIDRQTASSGMYAFGEGLETIFLVTLLYLLWPIFFNMLGRRFKQ